MPKKGGKRKKTRTHKEPNEEDYDKIPKTFVIKRGGVSKQIKELLHHTREIFYPYTAMNLKENENEKIKNIMKMSANFNVGSILMYSATEKNNLLKIAKTPKGPTFTFKINKYTNNRELQELLPRNKKIDTKNLESPLVIINGFSTTAGNKKMKGAEESEQEEVPVPNDLTGNKLGQSDLDLLNTMFNNLFPGINLSKSEPSKLKRCVLVDYDNKTETVDLRHYYIRQTHTGINNKIKKLVNTSKIPNLSTATDMADYFIGNVGYASDSDIDQLPNSKIEMDKLGKDGSVERTKVNLRLYEIGPRINMKLIKIEEGFMGGAVFYHRFKHFSVAEADAQKKKLKLKLLQKKERKELQEEFVDKKTKAEEMKSKLKDKKTDWSEYLDEPVPEGEEPTDPKGKKVTKATKLESEKYAVTTKGNGATEDNLLGKRDSGEFDEDEGEGSDGEEDGASDFDPEDGEEFENFDEFIDKFNMD